MTEPVDSPRQQLREALRTTVTLTIARIMGDKKILRRMGDGIYVDIDAVADAVIDVLVEAGWGPTAAHPDRIWDKCAECGGNVFLHDAWSHEGGTPPQDHEALPANYYGPIPALEDDPVYERLFPEAAAELRGSLTSQIDALTGEVASLRAALREIAVIRLNTGPHVVARRALGLGDDWSDTWEWTGAGVVERSTGRAALREAGGPEYEQVGWEWRIGPMPWCAYVGEVAPGSHMVNRLDRGSPASTVEWRPVFAEATREAGQPTPPANYQSAPSPAEVGTSIPPRCPTCGSSEPLMVSARAEVHPHDPNEGCESWGCWRCTDPWHAGQPTPEYERPPAEGPSCEECDVTMLLPWEGEGLVSIREAEGWTLMPGHGWRCPDHPVPPAPVLQEER